VVDLRLFSLKAANARSGEGGHWEDMKDRKSWLYAILVLVGGVLGGAFSGHLFPREAEAAAHASRELKSNKFVLVDADGNERGVFQVDRKGVAGVSLEDQTGRQRTEFRVGADGGAAVVFYDQSGSKRVLLGETPGGRDGLAIYSIGGRQIAGFTVADDNASSVTLYDPTNGRARVGLGVSGTGEPALVLFDQNGRDRAEMHVTVNGKPGLALADESGKSIAGLPMQQQPQPIPQE
jgi:hypothetical protein